MRKSLLLACSALGVFLAGEPVAAKTLDWDGTLTLDLGPLGSTTSTGVGVATLNVPTLTNNLRTLKISSASARPRFEPRSRCGRNHGSLISP